MNDFRGSSHYGKVLEIKVLAKLLELGYQVFRSYVDCSFDFLIRCEGDKFVKVEVKSVRRKKGGSYISIARQKQSGVWNFFGKEDADFFIGVDHDKFYVVPFDSERQRWVISVSRKHLGNWGCLPNPYESHLKVIDPYVNQLKLAI